MNKYILLLLLPLCSCGPQSGEKSSFIPTQNGFGVTAQPIGVDVGPGAELYYQGTNKNPKMVWPHIGTHVYPILYTNDVALLLADKPDEEGRLVITALIAVKGNGPAMDISDDILKIVSDKMRVDFGKALKACRPLRLNESEGELKVLYYSDKLRYPDVPDIEGKITWKQVYEIMADVNRSGRTNKVMDTTTLYLQKDYGQ